MQCYQCLIGLKFRWLRNELVAFSIFYLFFLFINLRILDVVNFLKLHLMIDGGTILDSQWKLNGYVHVDPETRCVFIIALTRWSRD